MIDFKSLLNQKEYHFLSKNEHLKNRIILLTLGGSYAYGTNNEHSDIDIRGCVLEKPSDLVGFSKFEQIEDKETDTVIYGFNKLIKLLISCNPNTIEMLGCKPEHYLYLSKEGNLLLQNRKLFLSKKCIGSFGGYAEQQINRLNNALARDRLNQTGKENHILNSLRNAMLSFKERYTKLKVGSITLHLDKSKKKNLDSEIFLNINLNDYPLRDFVGILEEMQNILRTYDKLNSRNRKRDNNHLDKHAMHLIRLYLMVIDILEKEEIITYREKDRELLLDIRNGKFRKENGTYDSSFFEMLEEYKKRFSYAAENTSLPDNPNIKKIEEFVMDINRKIIKGEI